MKIEVGTEGERGVKGKEAKRERKGKIKKLIKNPKSNMGCWHDPIAHILILLSQDIIRFRPV